MTIIVKDRVFVVSEIYIELPEGEEVLGVYRDRHVADAYVTDVMLANPGRELSITEWEVQ